MCVLCKRLGVCTDTLLLPSHKRTYNPSLGSLCRGQWKLPSPANLPLWKSLENAWGCAGNEPYEPRSHKDLSTHHKDKRKRQAEAIRLKRSNHKITPWGLGMPSIRCCMPKQVSRYLFYSPGFLISNVVSVHVAVKEQTASETKKAAGGLGLAEVCQTSKEEKHQHQRLWTCGRATVLHAQKCLVPSSLDF